ncbi:dihydrofolate reductase family protein [Pontibacter akesuensis]|uniref:Dihydrofolate reductase n=1 Tax=Pontibacter akesuensis TaxID=388950 RepID=A0A1I7JKV6_9BACT|nr:dihydrofolate reductase family protein [Pontibacter akesuensis]GHA69245.1 diacylglycerol kinase [Pontibacter akesuensis]SFU85819.1 Dihydrofolate reductase [Pontibacter akesuensis]
MRKVILYIAASLDGYIAKPDGDTTWLHDERYAIAGEDYGYSALLAAIDTTLMGHSTYKVILGFDMPFPYPDKTNYVFSRSQLPDTEHVKFVQENPADFVKQLKQQAGQDIWLIGGGQLNTLLLNAGLIDEIVLTYVPIILGNGISLFAQGTQEKHLQVSQSKSFANGFVQLTLAK